MLLWAGGAGTFLEFGDTVADRVDDAGYVVSLIQRVWHYVWRLPM